MTELKNISHLTNTSFLQRARGEQNTSLAKVDDVGLDSFSVDVEWDYNSVSLCSKIDGKDPAVPVMLVHVLIQSYSTTVLVRRLTKAQL